ncbi:MAG: hypothetical protein FJY48_13170, partial [Betaproteobacteria bacterium]|nr:hypothetical protein [Betaproteobacteria bacterium]
MFASWQPSRLPAGEPIQEIFVAIGPLRQALLQFIGIRRITREAYEIEATTARTWLESARVMRIGPGAI